MSKIGVRKPIEGVVYPPRDALEHYWSEGVLVERTLVEHLRDVLRREPAKVALSEPGRIMRYSELDDRTDRMAGALLQLGLQPLDRVVFQVNNSMELIEAFYACLKAGLIPICALAAHRQVEIEYLAKHAGARAHVAAVERPSQAGHRTGSGKRIWWRAGPDFRVRFRGGGGNRQVRVDRNQAGPHSRDNRAIRSAQARRGVRAAGVVQRHLLRSGFRAPLQPCGMHYQ